MYTDSWHAYNCFISFIFSSTCWFFDNIPIPSIFSEDRIGRTGIRQRQERSESKTCELLVHVFPYVGEHVFGHTFIVIEQFKKKLRSH
ncbi:hypothetical protein Hanom_Chr06g00514201 [Helianthus anomalus]